MTENNKIFITEYSNSYILCHIVNDKAVHIYSYELSLEEEYPVGSIINGIIDKNLPDINSSFARIGKKKTGFINGIYKCFPKHEETPFNAKPKDYDFLQIADFICTMKLIDIKRKSNKSSICEKRIFNDTKKYKTKIVDKLGKVLN